jgi:D-lactate dehydrogenase
MAGIMLGFGCEVVAADPNPAPLIAAGLRSRGVRYLPLDDLLGASDVVSLHLPLTAASRHLIGVPALARMKRGALLINTSRGGLLDTDAAILALKRGHLGGLGLDVYENEAGLFFSDHSGEVIADDRISRLMTFPNVVVTGHQAFLTHEAMTAIAATTFANIECVERGEACANAVH